MEVWYFFIHEYDEIHPNSLSIGDLSTKVCLFVKHYVGTVYVVRFSFSCPTFDIGDC